MIFIQGEEMDFNKRKIIAELGMTHDGSFGQAEAICFLYDTRLRFLEDGVDRGKGAPMACCLVYWGDNYRRFAEQFMLYGAVTNISNLKNVRIGKDRYYSRDFFAQAI